ncbi:MAG: biotin--[acetyl-CoA-carboxylase] ligase [Bacteroidales bacterium]|nr:biotin--[acetyl-CoA-carboxylase] ligase [Bacteroidales bacterium]
MCTIVYVDQAESTNSLLAASAKKFEHGTAIAAHSQTSGRGQRGNHWEAEPGKNLTFSVLLRPSTIMASHQFELLQLMAISVVKVLRNQLSTNEVCIKWPNDIYYRDKKICGILIENSLSGALIDQSIVGIGLNVNQEKFLSDAPNPTSMALIAGHLFDLDDLLEFLVTQIVNDFDEYETNPEPTSLAARYRFMMWRNEGFWPYRDNITGQNFHGRIAAIAPTGHLTLASQGGGFHTYAFKEVSAIL